MISRVNGGSHCNPLVLPLTALLLGGLLWPGCRASWDDGVSREIEMRLSEEATPPAAEPGVAPWFQALRSVAAVREFYEGRGYQPAWTTSEGPSESARRLLQTLENAEAEGLQGEDCHVAALKALFARPWKEHSTLLFARGAMLDLLLTDAFVTYANQTMNGRLDPATIDSECVRTPEPVDAQALLARLTGGEDATDLIKELQPAEPAYARLREARQHYLRLAATGGWPELPTGPVLSIGEQDARIPLLRERLEKEGYLEPASPEEEEAVFTPALEEALQEFQRTHGLSADGLLTPETLFALNASAAERAAQIALNLERWRWLPQRLGERHVLVNIAGFLLEAVAPGEKTLRMRTIVGLAQRRTPMFSSQIETIVLNPSWGAPPTIVKEDLLPKLRRDPDYLAREEMHVYRLAGGAELDPHSISWKDVNAENVPYTFRQDPGPKNPLGRMKFLVPNRFDVYLHDTPGGALFRADVRAFSSGCIRIEKPLELALFLLQKENEEGRAWFKDKLGKAQEAKREVPLPLAEPVPLHLVYWTAWVDEDGRLQFRDDVYGRDETLRKALQEPAPCTY